MRIGIQLLSLRPGRVGGHEVFVRRLIEHVVPLLGDDRLVIFMRPELEAEGLSADPAHARVETIVETPDDHYGTGYAEWNLRLLDSARLDVVYFPLSFFFPRPLPIPVAVHVADIQYEYYPDYFPAAELAWRRERIPESVVLADAVITHTESSARCLRERLKAPADRLHVVSPGGLTGDEVAAADGPIGPRDDAPFVLYPAADWPHKNHETLLRAVARLARAGRPEGLILTGMLSQRSDALRGLAAELGLTARVRFMGCVPQAELLQLYRAARLMAFPSRFEGFGLPLVEAMQLGCPVVASRAAAVAEVVGDAAVLCDDDPSAWAAAIATLSDDARMRTDLRRRGLERARSFDWTRCAAEHLGLLRAIARVYP